MLANGGALFVRYDHIEEHRALDHLRGRASGGTPLRISSICRRRAGPGPSTFPGQRSGGGLCGGRPRAVARARPPGVCVCLILISTEAARCPATASCRRRPRRRRSALDRAGRLVGHRLRSATTWSTTSACCGDRPIDRAAAQRPRPTRILSAPTTSRPCRTRRDFDDDRHRQPLSSIRRHPGHPRHRGPMFPIEHGVALAQEVPGAIPCDSQVLATDLTAPTGRPSPGRSSNARTMVSTPVERGLRVAGQDAAEEPDAICRAAQALHDQDDALTPKASPMRSAFRCIRRTSSSSRPERRATEMAEILRGVRAGGCRRRRRAGTPVRMGRGPMAEAARVAGKAPTSRR